MIAVSRNQLSVFFMTEFAQPSSTQNKVHDFGKAWSERTTRVSAGTRAAYVSDWRRFAFFFERKYGQRPEQDPATAFTRSCIKAFARHLKDTGATDQTICRRLTGVTQIWIDLNDDEDKMIGADPINLRRIRPRKSHSDIGKTMLLEDFLKLMTTPVESGYDYEGYIGKRDDAIIAVANDFPKLNLGRVARTRLQDVDLQTGAIRIGGFEGYLSEPARARIAAYLDARPRQSETLFATQAGSPITLGLLRMALSNHASYLGLVIPDHPYVFEDIAPADRQKMAATPSKRCAQELQQRDAFVIHALCWLACRPGELSAIKAEHVDLRRHELTFAVTKSQNEQRVPMPPELEALASPLLEGRKPADYVLRALGGPHIHRRVIHDIVRRHARRCNLSEAISPRMLRRTVATLLFEQGAPLELIAGGLLRHVETAFGLARRHYVRIGTDRISEVFNYHPYRKLMREGK
jgi:site-specific recombinase XerD